MSLPDNPEQACARRSSLRRCLASDETKMTEYKEFMNEMFAKDYDKEVPENLETSDGWYVFHHIVRHPKTGVGSAITRMLVDPHDLEALTPNHLLLGGPGKYEPPRQERQLLPQNGCSLVGMLRWVISYSS